MINSGSSSVPYSQSGRNARRRRAVAAVVVVVVAMLAAALEARAAETDHVQATTRSFESVNFARLAALADALRADVQVRPAAASPGTAVMARLRTSAAGTAEGCGFGFLANDDVSLSTHVPRYERAACADDPAAYRVQFVRPDALYEAQLTVPAAAAAVDSVTVTSNGGDGMDIDTLCVGFGGGGTQAFCVDRRLLDACSSFRAPDNASRPAADDARVFLGAGGGVRLSRAYAGRGATANCKEIRFRDVGVLARGLESLARDANDDGARTAVCSRIGLLAEASVWAIDAAKCYAEKQDGGRFHHVKMNAATLRDNCTRSSG